MNGLTTPTLKDEHDEALVLLDKFPAPFAGFELHRVPRWFTKASKGKLSPLPWHSRSNYGRFALATSSHYQDWLDHWGSATINGQEVLISQPYGLTGEDIAQLTDFCRRFGLTFEIDARSEWFPTRTLTIIVWPPQAEGGQS